MVIKGVRRCGKSMVAYLMGSVLKPEEFLVINFDDPRLEGISAEDVIKIVEIYQQRVNENLPKLLVLDEVQNVSGWEKVAKLYSEAKGVKVVVTGSSSKLMSEEYATVLTGRHADFELFPLSFREILKWVGVKTELDVYKNKPKVKKLLLGFLEYGGFPEVFLKEKKTDKMLLLRSYFRDIIMKDVVRRYRVREIEKIENLAKLYLSNISCLQSFNKVKDVVRLSLNSVERFSKYFETARLFFLLPRISYSLKEQILSVKKVYVVDTGFHTALGFRFSENLGRLMENLVAVELLRRKSYWRNNWEIYYWKNYQLMEVDFVVKDGPRIKQLIQVTYASGRDEIDKREIKGLLNAGEIFKRDGPELLVITWDYEAEEEVKGRRIRFVPLWKWLLQVRQERVR